MWRARQEIVIFWSAVNCPRISQRTQLTALTGANTTDDVGGSCLAKERRKSKIIRSGTRFWGWRNNIISSRRGTWFSAARSPPMRWLKLRFVLYSTAVQWAFDAYQISVRSQWRNQLAAIVLIADLFIYLARRTGRNLVTTPNEQKASFSRTPLLLSPSSIIRHRQKLADKREHTTQRIGYVRGVTPSAGS